MVLLNLDREAKSVFFYLIMRGADHMRTVTYGDVCNDVLKNGSDGLAARFPLGRIEQACAQAGIPHANLICVNKRTKRPGVWCYDSAKERKWRKDVAEIYTFDWTTVMV